MTKSFGDEIEKNLPLAMSYFDRPIPTILFQNSSSPKFQTHGYFACRPRMTSKKRFSHIFEADLVPPCDRFPIDVEFAKYLVYQEMVDLMLHLSLEGPFARSHLKNINTANRIHGLIKSWLNIPTEDRIL